MTRRPPFLPRGPAANKDAGATTLPACLSDRCGSGRRPCPTPQACQVPGGLVTRPPFDAEDEEDWRQQWARWRRVGWWLVALLGLGVALLMVALGPPPR